MHSRGFLIIIDIWRFLLQDVTQDKTYLLQQLASPTSNTLLEKFTVAEDMAAVQEEEEDDEMKLEKSKNLVKLPATLASIESLTFPLIQEVVLMADFRCKMCQDRVANIVSKFNGEMESMEIMIKEKMVILTFTSRYSRVVKKNGKKLEVAAFYKDIVNRISCVKRFLRFSNTR
ncbi:unnamed protein product [Lactuca virosa]|uniref:HMA domain-containing protein n=1 Tax=Lactuca virosa TaxID=75947 RepID=A0AAU9LL15_9ASTR|nr:unnamed protein product [Lactuca virosa]